MEPILQDVRDLARRSDPEFIPAFLHAVGDNFEYGEVGGERDDRYWGWYGSKELLAAGGRSCSANTARKRQFLLKPAR